MIHRVRFSSGASLFAGAAIVGLLIGCATATGPSPASAPTPPAGPGRASLPPNAVDLGYGMWTCERGYLMRGHGCVPESDIESGPRVVVSTVPSAGDGAESPDESTEPATAPTEDQSFYIQTGRPPLPDRSGERVPVRPLPENPRLPRAR